MKYFKITRTWSVKAEDEAEAFHLVAADPTKYLESEAVTRTEYKRPKQEAGWGAALRSQLVGSNSKRWSLVAPPNTSLGGTARGQSPRGARVCAAWLLV